MRRVIQSSVALAAAAMLVGMQAQPSSDIEIVAAPRPPDEREIARAAHRIPGKYTPHQGAREIARRKAKKS